MILEEKYDDEISFVYDGKNSYLKTTIIQSNGMISETFLKYEHVIEIPVQYYKNYKRFAKRVIRHKKLSRLLS